ncbi:hypothetical protein AA18889_1886 [Acetobacter senegalensis DSM 18889]|nr:hypothetical protein AA18889_1886 [Acetobacter senegalensis DSM 18889]
MTYSGPSTGVSAGQDTNLSGVDYALEPIFGQAPSGLYTPLRFTSVTLAPQDSESAPDEINAIPEVAQSVLTSQGTSGSIGGILSAGTFDDMLAGIMGADWYATPLKITVNSKATPAITAAYSIRSPYHNGCDVITTTASFSAWPSSGIIHILDATNNIDLYVPYISTIGGLNFVGGTFPVSDNTKFGDGATITLADIQNAAIGKTFTFRKKMLDEWELYTGTMVNQVQIQLQQGQPATIDIDLLGSAMSLSQTDVASSVASRTSSPLIDTVEGWQGMSIFGQTPAGCMRSATITLSRDGSGQDFGMGHTGACGMRFGSFKCAIEAEYFFKSYDQFKAWSAGKTGPVTIGVQGSDGVGYTFAALNGVIRNPKSPISGKNQTVVSTVSVTCNPMPGVGGTFAIFRTNP